METGRWRKLSGGKLFYMASTPTPRPPSAWHCNCAGTSKPCHGDEPPQTPPSSTFCGTSCVVHASEDDHCTTRHTSVGGPVQYSRADDGQWKLCTRTASSHPSSPPAPATPQRTRSPTTLLTTPLTGFSMDRRVWRARQVRRSGPLRASLKGWSASSQLADRCSTVGL